MKPRLASFAVLSLLLTAGLSARADFTGSAALAGSGEVPSTGSTGTGVFNMTYRSATNDILYAITFSGLSANASAAHIHFGDPTQRGPVILPFTNQGPPAATSGTFSGILTAADLLPSAVNGINTFADAVKAIQTGHTYANIHDATFPGGEIRGQISAVPEPASLVLLGLGLVMTAVLRTRAVAKVAA